MSGNCFYWWEPGSRKQEDTEAGIHSDTGGWSSRMTQRPEAWLGESISNNTTPNWWAQHGLLELQDKEASQTQMAFEVGTGTSGQYF